MKFGPINPRHPIRHLKSRIRYRLWRATAGVSADPSRIIWRSSDKGIVLENEVDNAAYYQGAADGSNCYSRYLSGGKGMVCRCWAGTCGFIRCSGSTGEWNGGYFDSIMY